MQIEIGKTYADHFGVYHRIVGWHPTHPWVLRSDRDELFERDTGRAVYINGDGGVWGSIPADPNNLITLIGDDK